MSDYVREKVLRIPFDKDNFKFSYDENDIMWSLEKANPAFWGYGDVGKFQFAPVWDGEFIDYIIEYEYSPDCGGDWGKVRELYPSEKIKYFHKFAKVFEKVNMDKVRLVEFCYYNGCDAPTYYDITTDPFYQEV